ncbi:acyltransferase [Flavobacterium sp. SM15]|uniref:acyltransferase family protein n=1 Tax=Flavobacterium sp. SM15 TaxID=2908005 RepID=UPI001EDB7EED|nr:acyltransferase [Flavobacterium sp. SM15]MCG2610576.1 acyltransferase [Flavobacterium sp. SM15]
MVQSERIFGLDLMRCIAILMVLCSHILWIYPQNSSLLYQVFTLFGFWGVEIFFVLSGFLIGSILYRTYLRESYTIKDVFGFLKRRWFRTLPNYYLVLLLNIAVTYYIGNPLKGVFPYFFFLQNFCSPMPVFFTESWSLSVEEFAYLLLPFALFLSLFLSKKLNRKKIFLLTVLILVLVFLGTKIGYALTTSNTTGEEWNRSLKAVVFYRIDSILIGVLASWLAVEFSEFWKKQAVNLMFLGFFLIGVIYFSMAVFKITAEQNPFFWNVLFLPLTSIVFWLFLPFLSQWKSANTLFSKPIRFVSIVSYSVYLLHYGIVLQLMKYLFDTSNCSTLELHGFTLVYLFVTFFLSFLFYKLYEKPLMDLRERF